MATKGQEFECRLARLLHHEGAFVRRAVNLQLHFDEDFLVTDIDVLAITFLPRLTGCCGAPAFAISCRELTGTCWRRFGRQATVSAASLCS